MCKKNSVLILPVLYRYLRIGGCGSVFFCFFVVAAVCVVGGLVCCFLFYTTFISYSEFTSASGVNILNSTNLKYHVTKEKKTVDY